MDDDPVAVARRVVREMPDDLQWAALSGGVLTDARTPGSDLDIVVVVEPAPEVPYRQSLLFAGWPVELFVYDQTALDHYLTKDRERRQPSLHRMIATGVLLTAPHPHHQRVRAACVALLAAGPSPLPEADLAAHRYALSDLLDDLTNGTDDGETAVLAATCWLHTAEFALHVGRHWLGSGKWLLRELRSHDPLLAHRWLAARHERHTVAALAAEVLDRAGGRLFDGYRASGARPPSPTELSGS